MLFWPRPSERLSLVDFAGFTARGPRRREGGALGGGRMAGEAEGYGVRGEAGAAQYGQTHSSSPVPV